MCSLTAMSSTLAPTPDEHKRSATPSLRRQVRDLPPVSSDPCYWCLREPPPSGSSLQCVFEGHRATEARYKAWHGGVTGVFQAGWCRAHLGPPRLGSRPYLRLRRGRIRSTSCLFL